MTGSLELSRPGFIASRLLSLPGGIHFRELILTWSREEDVLSTKGLVEGCSHSLEYLEISSGEFGTPTWYPLPHRQLTSGFRRLG